MVHVHLLPPYLITVVYMDMQNSFFISLYTSFVQLWVIYIYNIHVYQHYCAQQKVDLK
jgi:hypothetical protein